MKFKLKFLYHFIFLLLMNVLPMALTTFMEKAFLLPLNCFYKFVKIKFILYLYSGPLSYTSILLSTPQSWLLYLHKKNVKTKQINSSSSHFNIFKGFFCGLGAGYDENILESNSDNNCTTCEYTENHWIVHF